MNRQSSPVRRPATYQDVLDAPEHMVAELIRGALHLQPRPAAPHARAASMLGGEVIGPFDRGRGGPEPELHLGADVLVPDHAGWRHERMPAMPKVPWFELAPDWVCEVPSPGTRRVDLSDKRAIYAQVGVGRLWLIDPDARTLEAFALRDGGWMLVAALADEADARVAPFEAVAIPLAALWL